MTDTIDTEAPAPVPPPERRQSSATLVVAIVAAVAVVALAVVAVVAVARDDRQSMMANGQMPAAMTNNGSMMSNGSMMGGWMTGRGTSSPTVVGAREVAVSATSFRFTPNEIHVRAGEDVTIVLAAADVAHDFTIDALGVHVAAVPGTPGRGGLHAPSTPGRYTAYCSVAGHRAAGMTATVVVDAG